MDDTEVPYHKLGMSPHSSLCVLRAADTKVTHSYSQQVARSTLTRNKFRRIFSGSEAVVAGRLTAETFTSEVKGQSFSGNSSYYFTPITLPPADTNDTASSMERLWAYLTIQQLLEKQDASDGDDDNVTDSYCCDDAYGDDDDRNNQRNITDALTLALRVSAAFWIFAMSREMGC
jgi:hypothetical protein